MYECGEDCDSPFGVGDRAHRGGGPSFWSRATDCGGPLDCTVALHSGRTADGARAPRICGEGFLRWAGFLQLLPNKHVKIITSNLQQVALTVR